MSQELLSLLIGILGSVVASIIFLVVLFNLRPKIEFSNYIANQSKNGEPMYAFKIINRSWFPVTHLRMELTLITPKSVPSGVVLTNDLLELRKSYFFELGGYSKKDNEAHYALRVGSPEDLSSICTSEGQHLYLTISAQHSFSGFSRVFTKYYHPKSDIKEGHHEKGLGLDVK